MNDCECLAKCPFFNDKMANMPALSDMYKNSYCKGDWQKCARHMVFKQLGRDAVPMDLFPNQQDRATQILAA
jgi:hypothetical protein